jgi:hypothetical protein
MKIASNTDIVDIINHEVLEITEEPVFMRKARELGIQKYDVLDGRKKTMVVRDKELQMATNINDICRVRPHQNSLPPPTKKNVNKPDVVVPIVAKTQPALHNSDE